MSDLSMFFKGNDLICSPGCRCIFCFSIEQSSSIGDSFFSSSSFSSSFKESFKEFDINDDPILVEKEKEEKEEKEEKKEENGCFLSSRWKNKKKLFEDSDVKTTSTSDDVPSLLVDDSTKITIDISKKGSKTFDKPLTYYIRYTKEERKKKIERYNEKKKKRRIEGQILYECRSKFAKTRPRHQGRFIKIENE